MFFKTAAESRDLVQALGYDAEELRKKQSAASPGAIRIHVAESPRASIALAKQFVSWLTPLESRLLWIVEYGIWPSSENQHLYYRLRSSYGDLRELHEAPGHYFLAHEAADLATFLQLTLLFGWGAHVLSSSKQTSLFVSHDGWADLWCETGREKILADLTSLSLRYELVEKK
jgi:hypothetical protein